MRCNTFVILVLLACCCAGTATAQTASQSAGTRSSMADMAPLAIGTPGKATIGKNLKDHEAIGNAIAGALVSAISEQLGDRPVDMKLDAIDVRPLNIRDRTVSGTGSLRIVGDNDWMGFRFQVLYDSELGSTGYPEVSIGGVAATERDIPNDTRLVQQLDDQVVSALGKEFHQSSVRLQLDRISTVEAGSRYLRINADGIADFGRDGSTATRIEALYDRVGGQWLRVHYEMGDESSGAPLGDPLVKQ